MSTHSISTARSTSTRPSFICLFFFFNDTATTEIYTLSLHDALPISVEVQQGYKFAVIAVPDSRGGASPAPLLDRKSTRLNSSHANISYAVFCLKKKKKTHRVAYDLRIQPVTTSNPNDALTVIPNIKL